MMYPVIFQGYHFQNGVWRQKLLLFDFVILKELSPVVNMYGCHRVYLLWKNIYMLDVMIGENSLKLLSRF